MLRLRLRVPLRLLLPPGCCRSRNHATTRALHNRKALKLDEERVAGVREGKSTPVKRERERERERGGGDGLVKYNVSLERGARQVVARQAYAIYIRAVHSRAREEKGR